MKNDGGPAFPLKGSQHEIWSEGMTLRQYYAGQAMMGLLANPGVDFDERLQGIHSVYAEHSVKMADALLAELAKEE